MEPKKDIPIGRKWELFFRNGYFCLLTLNVINEQKVMVTLILNLLYVIFFPRLVHEDAYILNQ